MTTPTPAAAGRGPGTYEMPGFTIHVDVDGAGSTCKTCTAWRLICIRCQNPTRPAEHALPPPWGSSDSRADIRVCMPCHDHLVNAVRQAAGLPPWEPS